MQVAVSNCIPYRTTFAPARNSLRGLTSKTLHKKNAVSPLAVGLITDVHQ